MTATLLINQPQVQFRHDDGAFTAWGSSSETSWPPSISYYDGYGKPALRGQTVHWAIDCKPTDYVREWEIMLANERVYANFAERVEKSRQHHAEYPAVGFLIRDKGRDNSIFLQISYPAGTLIETFLTQCSLASRKVEIAVDVPMIERDQLSPIVSVAGFEKRFEPAFITSLPNIRPLFD